MLVVGAVVAGLGCAPPENSCVSAGDGVCDELLGCALGTDSFDCDVACRSGTYPDELAAACAHDKAAYGQFLGRNGIPPSEVDEAVDTRLGSLGSGGAVGTWDAVIEARGADDDSTVDRHYRVHVPQSYDPEIPTPLVFALGGFSVDLYYLPGYTELDRSAELSDVIVVYVQPEWRYFGGSIGWVFAWYVYEDAWDGGWPDNPDLQLLAGLHEHLGTLYNIDRARNFVVGHSRGAALALYATLEMPEIFAGFCAQAGFLTEDFDQRLDELDPVPLRAGFLVHGTADPDVPVSASDDIAERLDDLGWAEEDQYRYERLEGVTHFWQPQLNQEFLGFLRDRPMPLDEVGR